MKKEMFQSALRAIAQIIGVLIALGVGIPFLPESMDVVTFLIENLDAAWEHAAEFVGIVLTLIGFFYKSERWDDREAGAIVRKKAAIKQMSVKEYLDRAA